MPPRSSLRARGVPKLVKARLGRAAVTVRDAIARRGLNADAWQITVRERKAGKPDMWRSLMRAGHLFDKLTAGRFNSRPGVQSEMRGRLG